MRKSSMGNSSNTNLNKKHKISMLFKRSCCFFLFANILTYAQGQFDCNYYLDFSNGKDSIHITIDTISNPTNIWQIGIPQKVTFNTPGDFAIVTDTINSYPVNDTSIFILKHVACDGIGMGPYTGSSGISGMYEVDTDSLNDYGKIEFSPDNGNSWVLISDDTLTYEGSPWPTQIYGTTFTGSSNGESLFDIDLALSNEIFNIAIGDTVLFRLTFISDGTAESRDGLMFDDIYIMDMWAWGIEEVDAQSMIVFPNPASTTIQIQNVHAPIQELKIFSLDGRLVYYENNVDVNNIPIEFLKNGTYQVLAETIHGDFLLSRFIKI
jgi:hypothetical protein